MRKTGDNSNAPARIKLAARPTSNQIKSKQNDNSVNCDKYDSPQDSGQESDYENSPGSSKLNQLGEI